MHEIYNIEREIEKIRGILYKLIDEKSNLLDSQVIFMSEKLDEILNKYNKLLKEQNIFKSD